MRGSSLRRVQRTERLRCIGETALGADLEHSLDHRSKLRGNLLRHWEAVRAAQKLRGRLAGGRVKQGGSERIQVAGSIDRPAELLDGHVPERSHQRRAIGPRSADAAGAAKVHQDEAAVGPQENVVWLD